MKNKKYVKYIRKKCPKCGDKLLTILDYETLNSMFKCRKCGIGYPIREEILPIGFRSLLSYRFVLRSDPTLSTGPILGMLLLKKYDLSFILASRYD